MISSGTFCLSSSLFDSLPSLISHAPSRLPESRSRPISPCHASNPAIIPTLDLKHQKYDQAATFYGSLKSI
ncbi:hypothetical protein IAQ61_002952 [Plenodomus lingam]|uniref:uncharacterized protein n=1 Tax=Leptosphaeria maculans TaxID=5022 RepID=UPI00333213EC|nr:hypothetical protein IAQ61_002952 [Plenodomus lingam]